MDKTKKIPPNKWPLIALFLWTLSLCPNLYGQNDEQNLFIEETELLEIENRMLYFYNQLQEITSKLPNYTSENISKAKQQVLAIDNKWEIYCQSRQSEIANDDSLLQIVVNYQLIKQGLLDSISYKVHYLDALADFDQAEHFIASQDSIYQQFYETHFIASQDSIYQQFYETAVKYSLLKQLATQLEALKGKEQLLFADLNANYETAKKISQEFNELQPRFLKIEENFIALKNCSEEIQAQTYKPLFQRIKDYLYGLAAVTIILMYLNMVQAKIKALKQARENKFSQMVKDENDYPTI